MTSLHPRVGIGTDVHRLVRGRKLILGGVEIPSDLGLDGHSDADVVAHAIADALLGALSLGDIGMHFPNTDPSYKGASSMMLLGHVGRMIRERGYAVGNVDAAIVLERPKLAPYVPRMCACIAEALEILPSAVSVKATTGEGLGFTGRGEGALATAVALLIPAEVR